MKTVIIDELSKYFWWFADNESQFNLIDTIFDRIGGTRFVQPELLDVEFNNQDPAVIVMGTFLIMPSMPNIRRCYVGHGTSDKPMLVLQGDQCLTAFDWYLMSGPKDIWLFNRSGHHMFAPTQRGKKIGLLRSDWTINETYSRNWAEVALGMDRNISKREQVLVCFTFNSYSLELYFPELVKLARKMDVWIKPHDRELFLTAKKYPGIHWIPQNAPDVVKLFPAFDYYLGDGSSLDCDAAYTDMVQIYCKPKLPIYIDMAYEYNLRAVLPMYEPAIKANLHRFLKGIAKERDHWEKKRAGWIQRSMFHNDGLAQDRAVEFLLTQCMDLVNAKNAIPKAPTKLEDDGKLVSIQQLYRNRVEKGQKS
jgi:hypothetical protein